MSTQTKEIERLAVLISTLRSEEELKTDGDRQEEAARRQAIVVHLSKHPSIRTPDLFQKLWQTNRFAEVNSEQLKESLNLFADLVSSTWAAIKDLFQDFIKNFKPTTTKTMDEAVANANIRELSKATFQTLAIDIPSSPAIVGSGDLWNSGTLFEYMADNTVAKAGILNVAIHERLAVVNDPESYAALKEQHGDTPAIQSFAAIKDVADNFTKAGISPTSDVVIRYPLERLRYSLYYVSEIIQLSELAERKSSLALSGHSELDEQIERQEQKIGTIFAEAIEKYDLQELGQEDAVSNLAANLEKYQIALEVAEGIFNTQTVNPAHATGTRNVRTTFPVLNKNGKPVLILTNREYIEALKLYAERDKKNISVMQNLPLSGAIELDKFDFIQTGPVEDFQLTAKTVLWRLGGDNQNEANISSSKIQTDTLDIYTGSIEDSEIIISDSLSIASGSITNATLEAKNAAQIATTGPLTKSSFSARNAQIAVQGDVQGVTLSIAEELGMSADAILGTKIDARNLSIIVRGNIEDTDLRQAAKDVGTVYNAGTVERSHLTSVLPLKSGDDGDVAKAGRNFILFELYFMAIHALGFPGYVKHQYEQYRSEKDGGSITHKHEGWSAQARPWLYKKITRHEVAYLSELLKLKKTGNDFGLVKPVNTLMDLEGKPLEVETLDKIAQNSENYTILCAPILETGWENNLKSTYQAAAKDRYRYKVYIAPKSFMAGERNGPTTIEYLRRFGTMEQLFLHLSGKNEKATGYGDVICLEIDTQFADFKNLDPSALAAQGDLLGTKANLFELSAIANEAETIHLPKSDSGFIEILHRPNHEDEQKLHYTGWRVQACRKIQPLLLEEENISFAMPVLHSSVLSEIQWPHVVRVGRAIQTTFDQCQLDIQGCGDWKHSRIVNTSELNIAVGAGFCHSAGQITNSKITYVVQDSSLELNGLRAEGSTIVVKLADDTERATVNLSGANLVNCHLQFEGKNKNLAVDFSGGLISGGDISGAVDSLKIDGTKIGDHAGDTYTKWNLQVGALSALDCRIGNVQFAVEPPLLEADMPSIEIVGAPEFLDGDLEKIATYISLAKNATGQRNRTAGNAPVVDLSLR